VRERWGSGWCTATARVGLGLGLGSRRRAHLMTSAQMHMAKKEVVIEFIIFSVSAAGRPKK